MICEACNAGRHWECGCQTWCDCDCTPEQALMQALMDLVFYDEDMSIALEWGAECAVRCSSDINR